MRRRAILLVAGACVLAGVGVTQTNAAASAKPPEPPNVVLIVTDDQPLGTLDAMPKTRRLIFNRGVTYDNGIIPTSQCCPSRSALLTGKLAHTTQVYTNRSDNLGGWPAFQSQENTTVATTLDRAGYRTGLFGKYMNGWDRTAPPGWDTFVSFDRPAYYDYQLIGTGEPEPYGFEEQDYSTDVLADKAVAFLQASDRPTFLMFTPYAPHLPTLPAPRHAGSWPLEPKSAVAAFNEGDVSDKPTWVQRDPVNSWEQRRLLTDQHEALMAVDDAVGRLVRAMEGRPTLFVFLSDNGFMNGSHRLTGKDVPYDRSTRVPMAMRWTGVLPAGVRSDRITTNVDIAATILEATQTSLPGDGKSVLSTDRKVTLLEQVANTTAGGAHPAYCGVRTKRYLFVEYDQGEGRELYDYEVDPEELDNRVDDRRYTDVRQRLRDRAKTLCSPVPPGFTW